MMVYTKSSFKPKKKRKPKGMIAKRVNVAKLSTTAMPNYSYCPRPAAEHARSIQSHVTKTQFIPARTGIMDAARLAKETPEVREAIIAKSKRLAPAYNKGAVQYITDDIDVKTIGRKNPI